MGVKLRVVLAGSGLPERSHDQAVDVRVLAGAVDPYAGGGAVALEVVEDGAHREVVGFEQARVAGQSPPHRERLRRRERRIEPRYGGDEVALAAVAVDERGAEPYPRH